MQLSLKMKLEEFCMTNITMYCTKEVFEYLVTHPTVVEQYGKYKSGDDILKVDFDKSDIVLRTFTHNGVEYVEAW